MVELEDLESVFSFTEYKKNIFFKVENVFAY